jgi:hypothetical protein
VYIKDYMKYRSSTRVVENWEGELVLYSECNEYHLCSGQGNNWGQILPSFAPSIGEHYDITVKGFQVQLGSTPI